MRKKIFLFSLFFILFVSTNYQSINADEDSKKRIVLFNPTDYHLEFFLKIIENDMLDIEKPNFTAVFDINRVGRFEAVKEYIVENKLDFVEVLKMEEELEKKDLFRTNKFTSIYESLFKKSDGAIFFGGADIPASVYNEKTSLLTAIATPQRHFFELSFLFHLLGGKQNLAYKALLEENPNFMIVGFCLGMQTMNVATGGTMYQDIPFEIYGKKYAEDVLEMEQNKIHRNYNVHLYTNQKLDYPTYHQIKFVEDKFFTNEFDLPEDYNPYVLSIHHQAVNEVGKGFEIVATSMDGNVVEALRHSKYKNVFGFQFHPEAADLYFEEEDHFKYSFEDSDRLPTKTFMEKSDSRRFHLKIWEYMAKVLN